MALVKCKECGAQVSTNAIACPSCGAKLKQPTSLMTKIVAGVVLVLAANFLFIATRSNTESPKVAVLSAEKIASNAEANRRAMLMAASKIVVKERLKDPESASFSSLFFRPPGTICGSVNAKNGFGGFSGDKGFIVDTVGNLILIEGSHEGFREAWRKSCT